MTLLEQYARQIVETFEKAEAQGYHTRDRTFVLELLKPALEASRPTPSASNDVTEEMIAYGVAALKACRFHETNDEKMAAEVYRAMSAARPVGDDATVERVAFAIGKVIDKPLTVVARAAIAALSTASKEGSHAD